MLRCFKLFFRGLQKMRILGPRPSPSSSKSKASSYCRAEWDGCDFCCNPCLWGGLGCGLKQRWKGMMFFEFDHWKPFGFRANVWKNTIKLTGSHGGRNMHSHFHGRSVGRSTTVHSVHVMSDGFFEAGIAASPCSTTCTTLGPSFSLLCHADPWNQWTPNWSQNGHSSCSAHLCSCCLIDSWSMCDKFDVSCLVEGFNTTQDKKTLTVFFCQGLSEVCPDVPYLDLHRLLASLSFAKGNWHLNWDFYKRKVTHG